MTAKNYLGIRSGTIELKFVSVIGRPPAPRPRALHGDPVPVEGRPPLRPAGYGQDPTRARVRGRRGRRLLQRLRRDARVQASRRTVLESITGLGRLGYLQTPLPRSNRTRFP